MAGTAHRGAARGALTHRVKAVFRQLRGTEAAAAAAAGTQVSRPVVCFREGGRLREEVPRGTVDDVCAWLETTFGDDDDVRVRAASLVVFALFFAHLFLFVQGEGWIVLGPWPTAT